MNRFYLNLRSDFTAISIFTLSGLALCSCSNKMRISDYSRYNRMDSSFIKTYENDSLKVSMYFWGRSNYESLANKRRYPVPAYCIYALKSMGVTEQFELLLHLKPEDLKYAEESYAFLIDKKTLAIDTSLFRWDKTRQGDNYFVSKKWFRYGGSNSTIGGFRVGEKYVVLIETQSAFASSQLAASGEVGNIESQLQTLLENETTKTFSSKRDSIRHIIDNASYSKNYFKPITELQRISADTIWKYTLEHPYFQPLITRISYFDNLDSTKKANDTYTFVKRGFTVPKVKKQSAAVGGDAIERVYEIAKEQRMIMINECHYDYRHRLFTTLLLDSLYSIGYRNLCIEDRIHKATVNDSVPAREDGYYILDPFMAGLIRKAMQIGFKIYGYDDFSSSSIGDREKTQAKNLYNLFSNDRKNKWLVHAGYSHINKRSFMEGVESALQNFSKLAGFTPYSINQSELSDIINARVRVDNPKVGYYTVDPSDSVYKEGQSDLYIVNNIEAHPYEKPFPSVAASLKKYKCSLPKSIAIGSPVFIYVRKEREQLQGSAIPVYINNVNKERSFLLNLPKDEYSFVVTDSFENEIAKGELVSTGNK